MFGRQLTETRPGGGARHLLQRAAGHAAPGPGGRGHCRSPGATPSSATKDVGLVTEAFPPQVMEKMPPGPAGHRPRAVLHHGLQHGAERTALCDGIPHRAHCHRPQRQRGERQGNSGEADALWAGLLRHQRQRGGLLPHRLQDHPAGGFAHRREGGLQAAGGGLLPGGAGRGWEAGGHPGPPTATAPCAWGRTAAAWRWPRRAAPWTAAASALCGTSSPARRCSSKTAKWSTAKSACGRPTACASLSTCTFARPDSVLDGLSVYEARLNMGRMLAREHPVEADLVCGVPDSGLEAAMGYSLESGIPIATGFVKNRYIGRSFIFPHPGPAGARRGFEAEPPLRAAVEGKRVVLVDGLHCAGHHLRQDRSGHAPGRG